MLLTANTTAQPILAGGTVSLGSAVHGYGKCIKLNGNAISIGSGYYFFDASISMAVTAAQTVTAQLYNNGVAIPGAVSSASPTGAGEVVNLSIPWVFRTCCMGGSITIVVDQGGTINSVITRTKKER